jgi:dipeptidase E
MKLVFFSGGFERENKELNQSLVELTGKANPRITYIPAASYGSEHEFREFVKRFRKFNVTKFLHFAVDIPYDRIIFEEAFKSDAIFLSGGNTFHFLHHLRKNKLLKPLKEFVARGGVLAGLSAGAIIMTPNIHTAGFPEFDCDENEEGITDWKSLGLVQFEFFPHFVSSKRYMEEMKSYSELSNYPLYASRDGSGIIVDGTNIKFVGEHHCFLKGHTFKV